MESQVTYFVTYSCPRCKAELEVQHGSWQGWRRCPACGLPSLPPELLFGHPTTRRLVEGHDENGAILTDISVPEDSSSLDRSRLVLDSPSRVVSASRVVLGVLFIVSLFLLLLFYLDDMHQFTGVFGALSFIFLLLLLRRPKRRSKAEE